MTISQLEIIDRQGQNLPKIARINEKEIITPNFMIQPNKNDDYGLFLNLKRKYDLAFTQTVNIKLCDAHKILVPRITNINQTKLLSEEYVHDDFRQSLSRDLILIDPSLEYLSGRAFNRFTQNSDLPILINRYINNLKKSSDPSNKDIEKRYNGFVNDLVNDAGLRIQFIRDVLRIEMKFKADIFMPPIPMITNKKTLKLSHEINIRSVEVTKLINPDIECANYYLLNKQALRDHQVLDGVIKNISESNNKIHVVKFKYLDLEANYLIDERAMYKRFLDEISYINSSNDKLLILLESGNQLFPSTVKGFDIVSSSYNADSDYKYRKGGGNKQSYHYYYHPSMMIGRPKHYIETYYDVNSTLPCYCPICQNLKDINKIKRNTWNYFVRQHYLFSRYYEMKYIHDAYKDNSLTIGAIDKLKRSKLKNIQELI